MKVKRKVREDFDKSKEYSVNVSGSTVEEKEEVQQAFFDVGILWNCYGAVYQHLDVMQYSNTHEVGIVNYHLMYGRSTNECNMTAKEFLDLVYEPEQQGHVHAKLMLQYAEDAMTHAEPWKLWQIKVDDRFWRDCGYSPSWDSSSKYRRKPKTHVVHGVEIPDLRVTLECDGYYHLADPVSKTFFTGHRFADHSADKLWVERGLAYQDTEEGRQAAILHAKAMLGIA